MNINNSSLWNGRSNRTYYKVNRKFVTLAVVSAIAAFLCAYFCIYANEEIVYELVIAFSFMSGVTVLFGGKKEKVNLISSIIGISVSALSIYTVVAKSAWHDSKQKPIIYISVVVIIISMMMIII